MHSVAVKDFSKQTSEQFIVTNENAQMEEHFIATSEFVEWTEISLQPMRFLSRQRIS